jgi:hypothetical protein
MGSYSKVLEPWNDPQFADTAPVRGGALTAGTTLDANRDGTPINVKYLQRLSVGLRWLAGVTGAFSLEGSLDYVPGGFAGTWAKLGSDLQAVANSSSSNVINAIDVSGVPWVRLKWTNSAVNAAGTSAAAAWIAGKGF